MRDAVDHVLVARHLRGANLDLTGLPKHFERIAQSGLLVKLGEVILQIGNHPVLILLQLHDQHSLETGDIPRDLLKRDIQGAQLLIRQQTRVGINDIRTSRALRRD